MKKLILFILSLPVYLFTLSQSVLLIKSGPKGFYLEHIAAPKEGLFPLGRMYNVHPRHIANFNGIDFNKGLSIGQMINIPLTDTNFKQAVHTGVPVYYKTTDKEILANISVKYKASISSIRSWNKVSDDNIAAGTKLIIGFLITNEMRDRVVSLVPDEEASVSNVKKMEELKKQTEPELKKSTEAVIKEADIKKEPEIKKEEPEKIELEIKKDDPLVIKEEPKKTEPVIIKLPETKTDNGTGYFKNHFYQQVKTSPQSKELTVISSVFKTASGWQDGKYYLLINDAEPGTIVKLTNPTNGKIIFAKVLYGMDKIRENQGIDIRISDAAAAALTVSETDKFILKVNY